MPKANPADNKISYGKRAEYYFARNDAQVIADRYGISVKTARAKIRNPDSIPTKGRYASAYGNKLRNAINRTGKKYAYEAKMEAVKSRVIEKLDNKVAKEQAALDKINPKNKRAYNKQKKDLEAAKQSVEEASKKSAEELFGYASDVRNDRNWREWEAAYEANKGTVFL
jgi:hypothetical protein